MKSIFKEFYFDNKSSDIWINSVVILDANVLLNLYRYSKETSKKSALIIKKITRASLATSSNSFRVSFK
ncbi:PIN-like domain-containing protein [Bacillus sp. LMT]|uniref:PIN-like domain-containing protein n=1 Tax=Bacillus sp. LMT TaxID=3057175 RepID=UPI003F662F47